MVPNDRSSALLYGFTAFAITAFGFLLGVVANGIGSTPLGLLAFAATITGLIGIAAAVAYLWLYTISARTAMHIGEGRLSDES